MTGQLVIGNTTVDFTALLASGEELSLDAGNVICITGTQPIVNGPILAERLVELTK
jgi:hypothetical protein